MLVDALLQPWLERIRAELPGLELFDVHTHLGEDDPDGFRCSPDELGSALERAEARALVFPLHEPAGYPPANDRVIAAAADSGGRLVPLCRVDPHADPLAEAERALAAGARGIKLHPRAERFTLDHPALPGLFALAHERRLPIVCHAGRGIPALGRDALELCGRFPGARLILAHAGICDLAWIWREAPEYPNLLFDTAWSSPADLLALFALVPPGQILFGSDTPYGTPTVHATLTLRYALQAGLAPDAARAVAGRQLERIVAGEEPLDVGPPPGAERLSHDPLLDRIFAFLMMALGRMFRAAEPEEPLALAALACEVGDDAPQAPICRSILALLEERRQYVGSDDGVNERRPNFAPGIHLVLAAAGLSRTPDVPLPPDPVRVDVAERAAPH